MGNISDRHDDFAAANHRTHIGGGIHTGVLDGRVAAITGAGAGLGRAYAFALARAGACIVVNDADGSAAHAVVAELVEHGHQAVAHTVPVGSAEAADSLVAAAWDAFGGLDVMVANAGADRRGAILDLSPEAWTFTLEVHLMGTIHTALAAARSMRGSGGGSIVTVTSAAFHGGSPTLGPYCTAKGGIYSFTRALAQELVSSGVRVNAVSPPLTATAPAVAFVDSLSGLGATGEAVDALRATIEDPADVAPVVVYLASDLAKDLNGEVLTMTRTQLTRLLPPLTEIVASRDQPTAVWDMGAMSAAFGTHL